jgi:hypothetical protein
MDAEAREVVKELLQSVRAVSGLRFTAMTVFLTAIGGVSYGFYVLKPDDDRWQIALAGAAISIFFAVFEIALSNNLIRYWQAIEILSRDDSHWKRLTHHRVDTGVLALIRAAFLLMPALAAAWWVNAGLAEAGCAACGRYASVFVLVFVLLLGTGIWCCSLRDPRT